MWEYQKILLHVDSLIHALFINDVLLSVCVCV